MEYKLSKKYETAEYMSMIMGPNPLKLTEELLSGNLIAEKGVVCDLGSGQGLTSMFLAKEYGFTVFAADLWSDPKQVQSFFDGVGLSRQQLRAVKADATDLPFERDTFDAVVCTDSYNYFGRDPNYLDDKLLPFVKKGGYIYVAVPGMKKDCHDSLPPELLLSWTPEQLEYLHDADYWRALVSQSSGAEIVSLGEMQSNKEVWDDWLRQDNDYAVSDRRSMAAGGGKYLSFVAIVLRKK